MSEIEVLAPFLDLARRFSDRVEQSWQKDGLGDLRFLCPICGEDAFLVPGAGALGDAVWCAGVCDDGDVEAAMRLLASRLPRPCRSRNRFDFGHSRSCVQCQSYERAVAEVAREIDQRYRTTREARNEDDLLVDGSFILDLPATSAIWGDPEAPLSAVGQPLMLTGADGSGKTSRGIEYAKVRLRLPGWGSEMWGEPVEPLRADLRVLHIAADRPAQAMEAWARGVDASHRSELRDRVRIWRGPVPYSLATPQGQRWLLERVERHSIGLVLLDSRKDLGSVLDLDSAIGVNEAIQRLAAVDVEVWVLSHVNKGSRGFAGGLESVSGFREVFSGMGSVLGLDGAPGSTIQTVHHLKPIRGLLRPFQIASDHAVGTSDLLAGIAVAQGGGSLVASAMPVNATQVRALAVIDAGGGEASARSLMDAIDSGNLSRDLRELIQRGVIEHNGLRSAQSGYRRGPNAPA